MRVNALYSWHAENHMPQILERAAAVSIGQLRIEDPLSEMLIIPQRPLQHPSTRDSELCAACSSDIERGILLPFQIRRCPVEHLLPYFWCDELVLPVCRDTAGIVITAQIGVPVCLHVWYLEGVEGIDVGV